MQETKRPNRNPGFRSGATLIPTLLSKCDLSGVGPATVRTLLLSLSPFLDDHRYSEAVTRERRAASFCLTFGSTQMGATFMGLLINTVLLPTQGSTGSKTQTGQDDAVKKI